MKARAGERLARAEAVRWRNIVLEEIGLMTREFGARKREFGGLRLGEFEAALARAPLIGWNHGPMRSRLMMTQL